MRTGMPLLMLHDIYVPWWMGVLWWAAVFTIVALPVLLLLQLFRKARAERQSSAFARKSQGVAVALGAVLGLVNFAVTRNPFKALFVGSLGGLVMLAVFAISRSVLERNRTLR